MKIKIFTAKARRREGRKENIKKQRFSFACLCDLRAFAVNALGFHSR
jgi:hypothetical protein